MISLFLMQIKRKKCILKSLTVKRMKMQSEKLLNVLNLLQMMRLRLFTLWICSCSEIYIGETKRNVSVKWGEHNSSDEKLWPSKHLAPIPQHHFVWSILSKAPTDWRKRKVLEAYYISLEKPSINDQKDIHGLILFRNGIT